MFKITYVFKIVQEIMHIQHMEVRFVLYNAYIFKLMKLLSNVFYNAQKIGLIMIIKQDMNALNNANNINIQMMNKY